MTFAWNFAPVLVAALGKIRSSGSSVSSALVYSLSSALDSRLDLPKVTPRPSPMCPIWSIRVGGRLVLLLSRSFWLGYSDVRLVQILFVLNILVSLHGTGQSRNSPWPVWPIMEASSMPCDSCSCMPCCQPCRCCRLTRIGLILGWKPMYRKRSKFGNCRSSRLPFPSLSGGTRTAPVVHL
jgi:hypothetical protein